MENTGFGFSNDGYYYHAPYPEQSVPPVDFQPPPAYQPPSAYQPQSAYPPPYSEVSYPPEYAPQASYYSAPPEVSTVYDGYGLPQSSVPVQITYPTTTDPPPPLVEDENDYTASLMEDFIKKCKTKKNKERPASPPPWRRSRSRSPRRSISRGRCTDNKPAATFRPRSRTYRRSRSRNSSRGYKDRSLSSERSFASDEFNSNRKTKRKELLDRWRLNNCSSSNEMSDQLEEISKMKPEDIIEKEKHFWTRTAPADLYYVRCDENPKVSKGTAKLIKLCVKFEYELLKRSERAKEGKPVYLMPNRRNKLHHHKCCNIKTESDSDAESGECSGDEEEEGLMEELERKKAHPDRLHPELWYNDPGEMNDGPLCRCSAKAKRSGIRHNIYAGELNLDKCDIFTNNADRLYHYRITVSPPTNFLIKTPTIIEHDNHEYIFEGFSMLSHKPLENLPVCKVIRFNIEYTILYIEEKLPEHFVIKELDLFYEYLFKEILELVDLDFRAAGDSNGCSQFHFMPRFVRELPENGKELLSMNEVLSHLLASSKPLIAIDSIREVINLSNYKWQNYVDEVKGMVVTYPGKKPCSLRVDQLDRDQRDAKPGETKVPEIVHFGIRPPQLSYAGNPEYQKAWREYVKFRHLLANMPKASYEDKRKLESKENKLQEMRTQSKMKRDVTIAISAEGFYRTGIMCDIVQHAMLIPVLVSHLRFHRSLDELEDDIGYTFKNRSLLQLALTHPSYRENFGTNPDHARNSLTNCSIRQPEYGDRRIHYLNTRKRGINTLINIMSRFGKKYETESNITHNERLEFLGDAVVEFVTSIHLFHLFPRLEEGGLATYRAAIVQNQHLAVLAKKLRLDGYMLYAHGSDLCHDLELRHAMANCFEALMGALFLDGNIEAADKVFGESLFKESSTHLTVWVDYPPHPLQEQEPNGDRQWISKFKILQDLTVFEDSIGVQFTHIRLLARAFTDRSIGYTNLTLGSNQRLEFLGDTVLQLIASDYLYKYFPEHHEGHLSLLRSSLVNNRTQAVVCDDLGIATHAIYANPKAELKTKDRADLLEAFLGALYVDKGLRYCETFCKVCFFPRLHDFIMHQDWNDPKSKLQQCCLTLRTMEGGEPEIPIYKVIECMGPTNTRLYTVAVYFKGKRLAQATGHSIQQAEMNAAKEALENSQKLFPQLDHQKRVIAKSIKQDPPFERDDKRNSSRINEKKERKSPRKKDSEDAKQRSQTRDARTRRDSRSNSRSAGGRSPKPDREKDRSRSLSTFNSHEDARYRRITRHENVRSSQEPSCKSERSQSVRSSQSPGRSLKYEDYTKRNTRSSLSPGRKLKDEDYTKKNIRSTRREDSLTKAEEDKSSESDKHRLSTVKSHEDTRYRRRTRQENVHSSREPSCESESGQSVKSSPSPGRSLEDEDNTKRNVRSSRSIGRRLKDEDYTKRNVRSTRQKDSLSKAEDDKSSEHDKHMSDSRHRRHDTGDVVMTDKRKKSSNSNRKDGNIQSRDDGRIRALSKEEKRTYKNKDQRNDIDGCKINKPGHLDSKSQKAKSRKVKSRKVKSEKLKSQKVEHDVRDDRHNKKRSCSTDSQERQSKRRAVERRNYDREDSKLPSIHEDRRMQDDGLGKSDDRKSPSSREVRRIQADVPGRSEGERKQKRRTPSDEGEIFSTSSSSPKKSDDSSQDSVLSY